MDCVTGKAGVELASGIAGTSSHAHISRGSQALAQSGTERVLSGILSPGTRSDQEFPQAWVKLFAVFSLLNI